MEATVDTTEVRRWKRYDTMRDFEVDWLGEVPSHWETRRLTTVCEFQSGKAHEPFIEESGPYICVNSRFVSTGGATRKYCTENISPAKTNDILMVMSDLPNGRALAKAFFVEENDIYAVNQRVCLIRPNERQHARYLYYLLSRNPIFLRYDDGYNQTHLSNAVFTKFPLLLPPLAEQRAIGRFLDRETARIDALIGHKERLIALLEEKRQAVISHVVTRGLDPNVRIKKCGIPQLMEIPEHWKVKRLKYVKAKSKNALVDGPFGSNLKSEHFVPDGEVYVIESAFAVSGRLKPDDLKLITREHFETIERSEVRASDIVIAKIGANFGFSSILPSLDRPSVVSGNSMKLSLNLDICDIGYFHQLLLWLKWTGAMDIEVNITAQPALSLGIMNELPVCLPPLDEQRQIVESIRKKTTALNLAIARIDDGLQQLDEYRTALISAAVTGQIDVREEV